MDQIKKGEKSGHMDNLSFIADTLKSLGEDVRQISRNLNDLRSDYAKEVTEVKSKVCNVQERLDEHIDNGNQESNKKSYTGGIWLQVFGQFLCTIITVIVTLYVASHM